MKRLIPFLALSLFACEKAELPKPMTGSQSANMYSVTMGSDYANQLFFELATASVVAQNNREIWDLGFESGVNGRNIVLNTSKLMALGKTASQDLATVTSSSGITWTHDSQRGMFDSTAFYNWQLNDVYIIDRGNSVTGQPLGKVKMQLIDHSATGYEVRWGALNATTGFHTMVIPKADAFNFTFFSFNNGGQIVSVEPEKDQFDLCFTSYTHMFDDGTPYLVTGVIANRSEVRVLEADQEFDAVDYTYATTVSFPVDLDIIGYDWKYYNFDLAIYTVDFSKVYVVKSVDERYYKLRFLDFYDNGGSKGTPSFELQELTP